KANTGTSGAQHHSRPAAGAGAAISPRRWTGPASRVHIADANVCEAEAMDEFPVLAQQLASWDRLGNLAGAVVLAGGLLGGLNPSEWLARWSGPGRRPNWQWALGKLGALLVIAGIAGAIVATRSSRNTSERIAGALNAQAAAAAERAKLLERDAAQLRLQLAKLKWRVIAPEDQAMLVEWLTKAPKGPVILFHANDSEPRSYTHHIA